MLEKKYLPLLKLLVKTMCNSGESSGEEISLVKLAELKGNVLGINQ